MSTLIVTVEFPPDGGNGIASWSWDLAHALSEAGESVQVLAKAHPKADAFDPQLPFTVHRMPGRSWGSWQQWWARLAGGRLLSPKMNIIFSTWRIAQRLGPLAHRAGCRVGIAAHGSDITRLHNGESGFHRVDGITHSWLPVSSFLASELHRLGARAPIHVLPMPMNIPVQTSIPFADRNGLVVLSRLTPLKGIHRAFPISNALNLSLTVIGDGPEREHLESNAPTHVQFTGSLERQKAMEHVAAAQAILLLPEVDLDGMGAEGLGLCLLEAAHLGTPAIGCQVGGVPEAVGPGLLIDPENPDITAIQQFLADPSAGLVAQEWVQTVHGPTARIQAINQAHS